MVERCLSNICDFFQKKFTMRFMSNNGYHDHETHYFTSTLRKKRYNTNLIYILCITNKHMCT